jgi:hypothetical protein
MVDPLFEGQINSTALLCESNLTGANASLSKKPRDCELLDFADYRENTGYRGFPQGIERVALPLRIAMRIANCADVEGGLLISSDRI